ncbi:MAG: hypothetical protein LBP54_04445, partial [Campylobacteraceae bacterium]|nr:hypothetical protein [Campylobacteraceae bacterium]
MKYKKFKPIAITPLWAKIIIWIFTVYISAFVISILWLLASNIADEISYPYKNTTFDHVKLLFVPKNIFYADDLLFFIIIFIILLFILFPLIFVPIAYTAKFYSRKFKLSDIRNPEKYDPDVIRQYFPEYLSKKER